MSPKIPGSITILLPLFFLIRYYKRGPSNFIFWIKYWLRNSFHSHLNCFWSICSVGERRLGLDEKPLLVQLNWHKDDREGRFLLRSLHISMLAPPSVSGPSPLHVFFRIIFALLPDPFLFILISIMTNFGIKLTKSRNMERTGTLGNCIWIYMALLTWNYLVNIGHIFDYLYFRPLHFISVSLHFTLLLSYFAPIIALFCSCTFILFICSSMSCSAPVLDRAF